MNDWIGVLEEMPPCDIWVETKGGYSDERIVRDYFHSQIGYWMNQPGDPTHWRHIKKP